MNHLSCQTVSFREVDSSSLDDLLSLGGRGTVGHNPGRDTTFKEILFYGLMQVKV